MADQPAENTKNEAKVETDAIENAILSGSVGGAAAANPSLQGITGDYYPIGEKLLYHSTLRIGPYKRPTVHSDATLEHTLYIRLPLPLEMRDDTDVNYTNVDLQNVGDIVNSSPSISATALRNAQDAADAIAAGAKGLADAIRPGAGGIVNKVLGAVEKVYPPSLIATAISQKFGVAANPNPSVQFLGPALRTFTLTWNFNPRTAEESKQLHKTIKMLKAASLPSLRSISSSALLNYPYMVRVNFYPWDDGNVSPHVDKRHGWTSESIIRYGYSVMQNVNVNYAPSQAPAFYKGTNKPAMITLAITFKEIEYLLSNHWSDTTDLYYGKAAFPTDSDGNPLPPADPNGVNPNPGAASDARPTIAVPRF